MAKTKKGKKDWTVSKSGIKSARKGKYPGVAGTTNDSRRKDSPYYLIKDRINTGASRKFNDGQELFDIALDYFDAVDSNPMKETKVFGSGFTRVMDLQIPYTLTGFYLFAGITDHTFYKYEGYEKLSDATEDELSLSSAAKQIRQIIYTQKIEGASAGKFNHQIVALELGLAKKIEQKSLNVNSEKLTKKEFKELNDELESEY